MAFKKKASNEELYQSYLKTNNVWITAKEFNMCGQSVWERLKKINLINNTNRNVKNKFKDYDILKEKYEKYVSEGRLQELADELGRTKQFLCRKAKELGFTSLNRNKIITEKRIESFKDRWTKYEHPRGMLGKTHSDEEKIRIGIRSKERYANLTDKEKYAIIKKRTDNLKQRPERKKVTWKGQWQEISSNRYYFRSEWEYIYALYLEYLLQKNKIIKWEQEPKRFIFDNDEIVSSYLPDFRITTIKNTIEYHEVKGWMDERSQQTLFNMMFFYPEEKIVLIDVKWFKKNKANLIKYGYNGKAKF